MYEITNQNKTVSADSYIYEIKEGRGYASCQICGKPVEVQLPFVGCVFCDECQVTDNVYYEDTTPFMD